MICLGVDSSVRMRLQTVTSQPGWYQARNQEALRFVRIRPIVDGDHVVFGQSIPFRFEPTTKLQKDWQRDHPNGPELGHIVHLQFQAKSGTDKPLTVQIMGARPPYEQSMSERVDPSLKPGQPPDKTVSTHTIFMRWFPIRKRATYGSSSILAADSEPVPFKSGI